MLYRCQLQDFLKVKFSNRLEEEAEMSLGTRKVNQENLSGTKSVG
jgi:hypothetical protein